MNTQDSLPAPSTAACEIARLSRDARFDGVFFTAVLSTRIYCRPVCPARPPKAENVVYYPSAAAAQAQGFRPCLRCRPELAPGNQLWLHGEHLVARALKLINEGYLADHSLETLAERMHIGARQLRRLFVQHLGAPPMAVHATQRLLFAKQLLTETDLSITEVAMASGFRSLRRFNAAFAEANHAEPRAFRRSPKPRADKALVLRLGFRPPYDFQALLGFLQTRALPGIELVDSQSYQRVMGDPAAPGWLRVSAWPGEQHALQLDGFEVAVRAVLGQQVSVAAARTLASRIVQRYGIAIEPVAGADLNRLFPGPEQLADADMGQMGITQARINTIQGIARALLDGRVDFALEQPLQHFINRWVQLPGIGEWTAHYIAMRVLKHPDAFPAADLILRREANPLGEPVSTKALQTLAESWRPWRAYSVMYLWRAATDSAAARKEPT